MNLVNLKFTSKPVVWTDNNPDHDLVVVESEYEHPELEGATVRLVMTEENACALSVQIQQLLQDRDTAREEAKQQDGPKVITYTNDGKAKVF